MKSLPGILVAAAFAAATLALAPAALGAPQCKLARVAEWPLRLKGNRPVIDGRIDGHKVGVFLDTGAAFTLVSRVALQRLGITRQDVGGASIYGVGGASMLEAVVLDELQVGNVSRKNIRLAVAGDRDLGDDIAVILGDDFFSEADFEFDFPNKVIRLFVPRDCGKSPLAYWAPGSASMVELDSDGSIRFPVQLNGQPLNAMLDSGAALSALSRPAAEKLGFRPDGPGVAPGGCSGGIGRTSADSWTAPFERFVIGDEAIRNPRLRVADLWKRAVYKETGSRLAKPVESLPDLLLGADFLSTHRVFVSRSQGRMYFTYSGGLVFPTMPTLDCGGETAPEIRALMRRAAASLRAKADDDALAALDEALRIEPRNAQALDLRAQAHMKKGNFDLALADFDSAIASGARGAWLYFNRASAWWNKGDLEKSIADLDVALGMEPKRDDILRVRAIDHFVLGHHDLAERDFARIMAIAPSANDAMWRYMSGARAGRADIAGLRRYADGAKEHRWPEPIVRYYLGQLDREQLLAAAANADPKIRKEQECEARFQLGEERLAAGDAQGAAPLLRKAAADCPSDFVEARAAAAELARLP